MITKLCLWLATHLSPRAPARAFTCFASKICGLTSLIKFAWLPRLLALSLTLKIKHRRARQGLGKRKKEPRSRARHCRRTKLWAALRLLAWPDVAAHFHIQQDFIEAVAAALRQRARLQTTSGNRLPWATRAFLVAPLRNQAVAIITNSAFVRVTITINLSPDWDLPTCLNAWGPQALLLIRTRRETYA